MAFKKEIESCLKQVNRLEEIIQTASDQLIALRQQLCAMEAALEREAPSAPLPIRETPPKEEKMPVTPVFLSDKISKTLYADLKNSMSLNDRFRFQRDLFENNAGLMAGALEELNDFSSLDETLVYLNNRFAWNWEEESPVAFKEILEKRFA